MINLHFAYFAISSLSGQHQFPKFHIAMVNSRQ